MPQQKYSNYEEYGLTIKQQKPDLAKNLIIDGWLLKAIIGETNMSGSKIKVMAKDIGYTFGKQDKQPAHEINSDFF